MSMGRGPGTGGGMTPQQMHDYLFNPYGSPGLTSGLGTDVSASAGSAGGQGSTNGLGALANGTNTTGTPATDASGFGGLNFNQGIWDNPATGMNALFAQMGLSRDQSNPFFQTMQQLAPGFHFLDLFNHYGTNPNLQDTFLGDMGQWVKQGTTPGGLNSALSTLLSGSTGSGPMAAAIDAMSSDQIRQAIAAMVQTAGFGHIPTEMMQGIAAQLQNLATNWAPEWLQQQSTLPTGMSEADAFTSYIRSKMPELMGALGLHL